LLREDPEERVRSGTAVALADAHAVECVAELLGAVSDESLEVREMALLALGELGSSDDQRVLKAVERALRSEQPPLRYQSLLAYHRLVREGALEEILRFTGDPDPLIRAIAWRLLEERARESGPCADWQEEARRALADPVVGVRLAAALFLCELGMSFGVEVIAAALNGREKLEPADEDAAIEWAGRLGMASARTGLRRRARGGWFAAEPFAWHARVALARMGDAAAKQVILRGLGSWHRSARTLAVAAAGQARLNEARPAIEAMRGQPGRADQCAVDEALKLF
jgi:HEAT repeat protein